jgi:hypothetical protein
VVEPERAVVYTPQPGDIVVLECSDTFSGHDLDDLKVQAESEFGREVRVVVMAGVHFAGVVRE